MLLPPDQLKVGRSLKKRVRNGGFVVRFDTDFEGVMRGCATTARAGRPGTWITPNMVAAYGETHRRGYAHSVEVYVDNELVGGLYGISIGLAFFGESMFFRVPDASKVALYYLCHALSARGFLFIDCQQETPHLQRLGATSVSRSRYLELLTEALKHPGFVGRWSDFV